MILVLLYCIFYRLTMVFSQSFGIYSEICRLHLPQNDRFDGIKGVRLPGGTDAGVIGLMLGIIPNGVQMAVDAALDIRGKAISHDDRPVPALPGHVQILVDQLKIGPLRLPNPHDAGDIHFPDVLPDG